jgi:hypothetical protein
MGMGRPAAALGLPAAAALLLRPAAPALLVAPDAMGAAPRLQVVTSVYFG